MHTGLIINEANDTEQQEREAILNEVYLKEYIQDRTNRMPTKYGAFIIHLNKGLVAEHYGNNKLKLEKRIKQDANYRDAFNASQVVGWKIYKNENGKGKDVTR